MKFLNRLQSQTENGVDDRQAVIQPTSPAERRPALGSMPVITLTAALVLASPLLWTRPPWFVVWILVMALPYAVIVTRLLRAPRDRAGHALAMGVSTVMMIVGMLLVAVQWGRGEWLPFLFPAGLTGVHAWLLYVAIQQYRRGTSPKPHWRLLLRGFLDPVVYYGIVFILGAGASMHLD